MDRDLDPAILWPDIGSDQLAPKSEGTPLRLLGVAHTLATVGVHEAMKNWWVELKPEHKI